MLLIFFMAVFQGITEFLPVSSSGHLVFLEKIFGQTPSMTLNISLHLGTLISILIYYRKIIFNLIKVAFLFLIGRRKFDNPEVQLIFMLLVATAVTAFIGFALKKPVESAFTGNKTYLFLSFTFFTTSVILWLSKYKNNERDGNFSFFKSVLIGAVQGIAVLPGISRSGSTIIAGLFSGLSRKQTAEFSFLLAIPAIAGAGILESGNISASNVNVGVLLSGMIISAFTGYFALAFLIKILSGGKLHWFSFYMLPLSFVSFYLYIV